MEEQPSNRPQNETNFFDHIRRLPGLKFLQALLLINWKENFVYRQCQRQNNYSERQYPEYQDNQNYFRRAIPKFPFQALEISFIKFRSGSDYYIITKV